MRYVNFNLDLDDWEPVGLNEETDRLLARITINGVDLHLEAWAVKMGMDHIQYAYQDDENFGALYDIFGADGGWETCEINGRDYVLFASPYCS